jgi:competence protein ComEC
MPLHDKAFWSMSFFLVGVLLASVLNTWPNKLLVALLASIFVAATFLILEKKWLAVFSLTIFLGAGYYFLYDHYQKNILIPYGGKVTVTGLIKKVSAGLDSQGLILALRDPYHGKIRITADRYPEWRYGDLVTFEGVIQESDLNSSERLSKDGIFGMASFPKIKLIAHDQGSLVMAQLLAIKQFGESSFKSVLPPEKAAFLAGLTLGDTAEFSKAFREKMSLTGTSHLVALSGYNVTVIAKSVMATLGLWLSRKKSFWFGSLAVLAFVLMTGAEASVMRAAIMAFLVLLAEQTERVYSFRNAIAVAAFAMILINPKILRWDVGFQLSFAALLGIVYLRPAIAKFFKVGLSPGFLNWRENLLTTASAQGAVLPILLANFGMVSPISLLTNVLILVFVPATMFFGFMIALANIVSFYLAWGLGLIANLFLSYELGVINFFSQFNTAFHVTSFDIIFSLAYYAVLIAWIFAMNRSQSHAASS